MPGETSLLLPRAKTPFRSNDIVVSAIGLLLLLTLGAYSYRNSSSIGMGLYGTKDPPPRGVFHADVDQSTGLTGIYGVDDTGNYRLFARGEYLFNVSDSNWNYLNIESTPNDNDNDYITTMRAVGFLEGRLTCGHMKQYYLNFMHDMFEGSNPSKETQRFLNKNYKWTLQEANKRYRGDDYWLSVKGILSQLEGMLDGYRAACPCAGECSNRVNLQNLDNPQILHFLLLNADGDLYQITEKYSQAAGRRARRRRLNDKSTDDESSPLDKSGKGFDSHCSALIKLLPGNSDLLIGHDTW